MNISSLGDLARSFSMQSRTTEIKADIQRLTEELSTGQVADVRSATSGKTAYVIDLESSLKKLDGYDLAVSEAGQFAEGLQTVLTRIGDLTSSFRDTLITSNSSALDTASSTITRAANDTLEDVIGAMNTNYGGRTLLAGIASDTQPIVSSDDILTALTAEITGAGTVDDIILAAENWFNDPAGFVSIGYQGSDTSLSPIALSDSDNAVFDLRGDDPIFLDTLKNLALAAIASDTGLGLSDAEQSELFEKTTNKVIAAQDAVIDAQTLIGFTESRIETISVRQSAERTSLQIARNDILSSDPYVAATELEQVQFQLQSLYTITSRMSQLSLVNYL
ncbi:MAG: flagellin [Sulfitobacter sp.]